MRTELPIAMSNRHCHLTKEDIDVLFGEGYQLTPIKDLSQPHQFASDELVEIKGPKGSISGVRVLGPARTASQVEVLASDCYKLGIPIVIRESGKLNESPSVSVIGPKGTIELKQGAIVAARHIHMNVQEAKDFNVENGEIVNVEVDGPRGLIFKDVLVRSGDTHALEMHVDTEEGNAAGVKNGQLVKLIKLK
jgi:putative phosphotransacetylase